MNIRPACESDLPKLLELYRNVAAIPGGLARLENEIDEHYIQDLWQGVQSGGISLVACEGDLVAGEIHAMHPGIKTFAHILDKLTIAVSPACQGSGIGRRLFESFLTHVTECRPEILRVELIARESNIKALAFYKSLGFQAEGRLDKRIHNVDGSFEADIPMAWHRN